MVKYVCKECGYVYDVKTGDPDNKIKSGTEFKDISKDWVCPLCASEKEQFAELKYIKLFKLYLNLLFFRK